MKLTHVCLAFLSIPLLACSNDPLEPGEGSDPGAGTNTLQVNGSASAEPHGSNGKLPADFSTDFSVRIELNGQPVTTNATVTVSSLNVNVTLLFNANGNGRWEGTAAGYDESYRLDVVSGTDKVNGVIVDGPGIHTFTAPLAGAALDSTLMIPVNWDRSEGAEVATIRTENIDRITIPDSGTYMLPPNALKAEKDKTQENTIELQRTNRIIPAGAIGDSSFSVSIQNDLDVIALANPAL